MKLKIFLYWIFWNLKSDVDVQRKREEKEALINEKIEAIRLKNQERLRKFQVSLNFTSVNKMEIQKIQLCCITYVI